jgi:hypothetical protein
MNYKWIFIKLNQDLRLDEEVKGLLMSPRGG